MYKQRNKRVVVMTQPSTAYVHVHDSIFPSAIHEVDILDLDKEIMEIDGYEYAYHWSFYEENGYREYEEYDSGDCGELGWGDYCGDGMTYGDVGFLP